MDPTLATPITPPALRIEALSWGSINVKIPIREPRKETRKKSKGRLDTKQKSMIVPKEPAKAIRGLKMTARRTPMSATGIAYSNEDEGIEGKPRCIASVRNWNMRHIKEIRRIRMTRIRRFFKLRISSVCHFKT
jgi:hypothetical protein